MENLIDFVKGQPGFLAYKSISEKDVKNAEMSLGISFADDYRKVIKEFGVVSFNGHELTGICNSKRLNIVDVTIEERKYNNIPNGWYVIEQANIDGIVIWQDANGIIYETRPNAEPRKLCNSLLEYIDF